KIPDPLNPGATRNIPPSGSVAGIYASNDSSMGVWHAPAGEGARISGIDSPAFLMTDTQAGSLNLLRLNAIRELPLIGTVVWGARTLAGPDSDYKYVPVKRL